VSALIVAAAAACVAGCTWVARGFARRYGIVNHPNPIVPQHVRPVPYLGGVGLLAGVAVALALMGLETPAALALPALLYVAVGTLDDVRPLRAAPKLALQVAVAVLAVALGVATPRTGVRLVDGAACALWVVTLVNALNFTDVCDGLAAGLAAVTFAFIGIEGGPDAPFALALAGGCAGFLAWNAPPAKIFLGDAGSHLLGFAVAALTWRRGGGAGFAAVAAMALAALVPLFELCFITAIRVRKGIPFWKGSPDHFSLRLQAAGLSKWPTDAVAWSAAAAGCAAAHAITRIEAPWGAGLLAVVAAALAVAWHALLGCEQPSRSG
jgi:UDP-GlcNAc:undecaprenyl-phosphate GlcNAc-1-phosphate transferase